MKRTKMIIWNTAELALKQFRRDHGWTVARVLIVAAVAAVVIFMTSLEREYTQGPVRYLNSLERVDWWVVANGSENLAANSTIPSSVIEELEGRGEATTVYWNTLAGTDVLLQTYQPGGVLQPKLAEGRNIQGNSEIVVDQVMADQLGIETGSNVSFLGQSFEIVGLSEETNSHSTSMVFLSPRALQVATGFSDVSAIAGSGAAPELTSSKVKVVSHQQFIDDNRSYWEEKTSAPIQLVITVSVAALALILAVFLMLELRVHQREKGIMKSMATIGAIRLVDGFVLGFSLLSGLLLAVPIGFLLVEAGNGMVAGTSADLRLADVIGTFGYLLLAAIVASIWPMHRLKKLSAVELLR